LKHLESRPPEKSSGMYSRPVIAVAANPTIAVSHAC
jgi:hypothetical protein